MEAKRYYWLRLKEDFFDSKRVKKLRRMAGGDTLTIIYLKMQLKSIKNNGVISWTGLEDTFADELALDLDETPENVALVLSYLISTGLAETQSDGKSILLPYAIENTGSEGASAQRVREYRERQLSQSDANLLQCNTNVTQVKQIGNGEIEIDKRDRDIAIDRESAPTREPVQMYEKCTTFVPPSVNEVNAYAKGMIDAKKFVDYYSNINWTIGRERIDWKTKVDEWIRRDAQRGYKPKPQQQLVDQTFDADAAFAEALQRSYGTAMASDIYNEEKKK